MGTVQRTLFLLLSCVVGTTAMARNIFLDLSGAGKARVGLAYSLSSPADAEEVRSHSLGAGAAKVVGLEVGDVVAFKLFDDKTLEVALVEETHALSGRAFLGSIDNSLDAIGCVVLETEAGIILDVTDFENQRVWKVVSDGNGVTVREIKPDNTRRCYGDTLYRPVGQAPINVSVSATNGVTTTVTNSMPTAAMANSSMSAAALAVANGEKTVDILVNYDTDAAAWAKSNGGGLLGFAETCVQKMNAALANTGLTGYFRFRLVGVYEVGGSARGDIENALYYASGYYAGTFHGVNWAGVCAERERVGADIVCTLCDNGSEYGVVGIGWALMSYVNSADCGFNACQIRSVANSHTMTHEVGHNMGAGHGDKMASSLSPGPQYYSYSSGYYFTAGGRMYHTVMAYNSDGYGNYYYEAPYFSSPNHTYNGVVVGTAAKNDNTRTLRENWRKVAANMKETVQVDPAMAYTIVFNRMDYSGAEFTRMFYEGTPGCLPTLEDIGWSYSGHYFMGWSTRIYNLAQQPAAVVDFIDGDCVEDLAPAGETVYLYAVWSASPPKSIPSIPSSASAATVNATVDGVGFADADVKNLIGGSASKYLDFRTWARGIKGGESAVALSPHAAAAYLLGAESLFGYAPAINLEALEVGIGGGSGMTIGVEVKDGERSVVVDSAKIKSMVEATGNLNDWSGAAKLTPTVTADGMDGAIIRLKVTPGGSSPKCMFIRLRKQL